MTPARMLRSIASTGAGTLASRVLGLVRDVIIASVFGAGASADAFFVAFRIPNFFRRLFAEGAFAQAFVPVMSEYRTSRSEYEIRDLASHVGGVLGVVLLAVTGLGILSAPLLVYLFAPGFAAEPDKAELTVSLLRITFPYLLFISLTAFAGGILNAWGRFGVPAVTPSLLNIALIGAALGLAPRLEEPVTALAWGVFVGGLAQLAFQMPFLWKIRLLVRPRFARAHEGVRRIVGLIVPALLGVSVAQVNLLVDTFIASFLVTGSISWLYYSDRLMEFPLGVFGIALATVILPSLSIRHAEGDERQFSATVDWALRLTVVVAVPAMLGLVLLAAPMICAVFRYGAFGAFEVRMVASSLAAYAAGLVAFIAVKVFASGYYARQEMRAPVRIAVIAMAANVVLNIALVGPLAHTGLALATSLAAWLNAGLLLRGLLKRAVYRPRPGWPRLIGQCALAGVAMTAVLVWLQGPLEAWLERTVLERAAALAGLVVAGGGVWFAVLAATGVRPREFLRPDPDEQPAACR